MEPRQSDYQEWTVETNLIDEKSYIWGPSSAAASVTSRARVLQPFQIVTYYLTTLKERFVYKVQLTVDIDGSLDKAANAAARPRPAIDGDAGKFEFRLK